MQGHRFARETKFRRGYDIAEVDAFLDTVEYYSPARFSAADIRAAIFSLRFGGYKQDDVDLYLDDLERKSGNSHFGAAQSSPSAIPRRPPTARAGQFPVAAALPNGRTGRRRVTTLAVVAADGSELMSLLDRPGPGFELVATAHTVVELVSLPGALADVVLLDVGSSGGTLGEDVASLVRVGAAVIAAGADSDPDQAIAAGAHSHLAPGASPPVLRAAIIAAADARHPVPRSRQAELDGYRTVGGPGPGMGRPARVDAVRRPAPLSAEDGYGFGFVETARLSVVEPARRLVDPPPPDWFLSATFPAGARVDTRLDLVVQVLVTAPDGATGAAPGRLAAPAQGSRIHLVLELSDGLLATDGLDRDLFVPPVASSEPVRFEVHARAVGPAAVKVTAWDGGTFLGEIPLRVAISVEERNVESRPKQVRLHHAKAHRGDVALLVRQESTRLSFQLLARSRHFDPVVVDGLGASPGVAVERAVAAMHGLTSGSGHAGSAAGQELVEIGVGLWRDLVPETIKDQFWELQRAIGSFTITTSGDTFPWELLYPLAPGRDEGFLVDQFPVVRRAWGQETAEEVSLRAPAFVVPEGSSADAQREVDAVSRIIGGTGEPSIGALAPLHETVNSGKAGLLHFTCHDTLDPGEIMMPGGPFRPVLLNAAVRSRSLAEVRPLVFVNASRCPGTAPQYVHPVNWATQFMAAGAGAFIGTAWTVHCDSARKFAETFYGSFIEDTCTLGEATMAARAAVNENSLDPTWLAYTVYGDADAIAVRR